MAKRGGPKPQPMVYSPNEQGSLLNPYGMRPPTYQHEQRQSQQYPTIAPVPTYRRRSGQIDGNCFDYGVDMNAAAMGDQFGDHPPACDYITTELGDQ